MPRPVLLLMCEGIAEDKHSSLVSAFSIIETLEVNEGRRASPAPNTPAQPILVHALNLKILATWMKTEDDPVGNYEYDLRLILPNGEVHLLSQNTVAMEGETRLHRQIVFINGFPPFLRGTQPGIATLEHRVRLVESSEWITQQFPFMIEVPAPTEFAEQAPPTGD